ncbi:PKD domain-containing protein [Deinococcus marmoris]|uniref:PKD domain-containing protein n=1 Tax=Deinococcus marmoris TaxID=249408 RepID=UPI000494EFB1|nr:hypothetical protein [Deinococcus marmoris]
MKFVLRLFALVAALLCLGGLGSPALAQPRDFLILSPRTVTVGQTLTATVSSARGVITWGDGSSSPVTSLTVTHVYKSAGGYGVGWLCNGLGSASCASDKLDVTPLPPTLSVSPTSVQVGEKVTATLTDFQPGQQLDWGDGITGPAASRLERNYSKVGTFTVRLLGRDGLPVSGVPPVIVTVLAPVPTLSVSPTAVQAGEKVTATLTDFQSIGGLDWGDGTAVGAAPTLTHAYARAGTFTVRVTGSEAAKTVPPVIVTVSAVPTITLKVVPTAVQIGQPVTAVITNLPVLTAGPGQQLDWGDGTRVPAEATLTHAYPKAGTFTVRILGGMAETTVPPVIITVTAPIPTPTLSVSPNAVLVGEKVTATVTNFQTGDQLDWGDGSVVNAAPSLQRAYGAVETFTVRLLRGGKPILGVAPVPVVVSLPTPTLNISPNAVQTGEKVTAILANTQPGDQLDWGDNSVVSAAASLTHAYGKAGAFSVRLLRAGKPLAAVPPAIVTVTAPLPNPTLGVAPPAVLINEEVTAKLANFQPGDQLDWGDGSVVPAAASLSHSFGKPGTFLVRLLDANARPYPATPPVPVVVSLPNPTLNVTPGAALVGEKITATLTAVQTGDQLDWGDGAVVNAAASLQHTYSQPGTFTVRLLRGGKPAPGVAPVVVVITLPTPTLAVSPPAVQTGEKITATLTNFQTGDQLDWGDGSVVPAVASLSHAYGKAGVFTVRLLRGGKLLAGVPPAVVTVTAPAPTPTMSVSPTAVQTGEKVTATLTGFKTGDQLDWGDGTNVPVASSLTHVYSKAGTFAVRLLDAKGAPVSTVAPQPVLVSLSTPTLAVSPNAVQISEKVTAILTNTQPGDQLGWGDGSVVPVAASLTHTYSKAGTFAVKLLRGGQSVAGVTPVPVVVILPVPTLSVSPASMQTGQPVTATLANIQPGDQLDWGDTTVVPAAVSLNHSYGSAGTYLVRLLRGGAPLGSVAPVPVTVTVQPVPCSLEVLTVSPVRWKAVEVKVNGLAAGTAYTLDWNDGTVVSGVSQALTTAGDGSKQNVQQRTYGKAASFVVQVKVGNAPPCIQPITVVAAQIPLAVDPAGPAVDQTVTLSVGDVPAGTALKVDWGDGQTQTLNTSGAGDGTFPLGTHVYVKDGTFLIKVSLNQTSELLGTLPVVVTVPMPTLEVLASRAGTPSTVNVGNIQSYPQYVYTLDFGDGTPKQSVKADAEVPHVFAVSGVYTVKLTLKADQASERTVVVAAVIDAAVGIKGFSTEIRPLVGAAIAAPTPAEIRLGMPTRSVALLNVSGSGTVNLRWTWTPLNVKDQPDGQPLTLDTRQVLLNSGQNTVPLTLPDDKSGRFLLRVEVLGVTGDSKAVFPGQISLQTVNLTEPGLPKFLVVGEGEDRFKFKILGAVRPQSGPLFNPDDFGATLAVADDTPLVIGLTPVALGNIGASHLKVKVDGDTAYLVSGSFTAEPPSPKNGAIIPNQIHTVYTEFPAFSPMRLRVGRVTFSASGAVLNGAVVTSPDFTLATVVNKPPVYTQERAPGPRGPQELINELINQVFDPAFNVELNSAGTPVMVAPEQQRLGLLNTVYAQGKNTGVSDVSAPSPFLKYTQTGQLPTSTGTGIGYATDKGRTALDQAASKGVSTGNGVGNLVVKFPPPIQGTGPKTVEQLQEILGAGQTDFLTFPELYLSNAGDVVSARVLNGRSVASFPTLPHGNSGKITTYGGVMKLGDSGVSVSAIALGSQTATAYLDLSSKRSVEPDGAAVKTLESTPEKPAIGLAEAAARAGGGLLPAVPSQAALLRQTYGGAPSAVTVPDVGPQWQGLLWLSNQITIDTVAQYDATKGDSETSPEQTLSVELVKKVPVSYGTRGWNLNIDGPDGKVAPGKTELTGGIPYDAREVVVVMVKTNLIRSLTTGAFGPLPFVGGGKLTGTWYITGPNEGAVTLDKTGLTRAYGPDGSFTARDVQGSTNLAGVLTFNLLGSTFDLSRIGDGLKLNCYMLIIDGGLVQLPSSRCDAIQGQDRKIAGNPITLSSMTFSKEDAVEATKNSLAKPLLGKMILAGLSALGNADENGKNVTAPSRFVLGADAQDYKLKLSVDDVDQEVMSTTDNKVVITLKGSETDLTGLGLRAFGAGEAPAVAQELAFDSGSVGVSDKLSMQVKGLFGHKGSKSYWYLLANAKVSDGIPLSIITIYQVTGGLAYNMQWGQGQIYFSDLNKRPNDGKGLHLTAGVVASFTGVDDTELHAAIVAEIGTDKPQLRFGGDGYLLTGGINTAAGYFGGGKPQARFAGTVNLSGLFVDLCVGPASVGELKCSDLRPLSMAGGILTVQGAASIAISETPHLYIGTFRPASETGAYCNPTNSAACAARYRAGRVSVQVDLAILKASVDGYVMTGKLDGRAPEFVKPVGSFGLAAGAAIENIYHAGGGGSALICNYSWSFDARLYAAVDGAVVVSPTFKVNGHVGLYAGARVSAHLCGIGGSISASVSLDADFQLSQDDSYVKGTARIQISLPVFDDVDIEKSIRLSL